MTGLLSLPSELLHEIIETCSGPERCLLRATCKILSEHADPIVFRRLSLYRKDDSPDITEQQIIALATRSSRACEFTTDLKIDPMPEVLRPGEWHPWPHVTQRAHLQTAISTMRNLTRFRWVITEYDHDWLIDSLIQVVSRLPQLAELDIYAARDAYNIRIPLSLFAHLSRLTVGFQEHDSLLISEMAAVIANSPQLRSLDVRYSGSSHEVPTLGSLFAKITTNNHLCLEHLSIESIDATVNQATLPHLLHLTSFRFCVYVGELPVARSVWTSFLNNNIKLSDVLIQDTVTKETILYLSSFSGLKSLEVFFDDIMTFERFEKMLFEVVLPKHTESLQTLKITNSYPRRWAFDRTNLKTIMNCLKLRDLFVQIDGEENGTPVQLLFDTVAHLPALKILRFNVTDIRAWKEWHENFKPSPGLRYPEELEVGWKWYVLEKEGGRPVRYREIN